MDLQEYVGVWTPEILFDLRNAVLAFIELYGNGCSLNWIDTSKIVDFSNLFNHQGSRKFDGDIS